MPVINYTTKLRYVVTAEVPNVYGRDWVSKPLTKKDAEKFAKRLRSDMRIAIPKYRWAKNIKVERVDI